jgi:DNA-binding transcriptional LysR family regulator
MKNATLRQLRIFATVARQLSFTRAASVLYMTQPAVSAQIHQLEEEVSSQLFDRIGRSVRLTEAGERLLVCIDEIEASLRKAEGSLAALRGVQTGALKFGAVDTANYFAASLVNEFGAKHPAVTVRYTVDKLQEIVRLLIESQVEVVILSRAPSNLDIISEPFARHPYVVIASPDHPLAGMHDIPLQRLFEERFVSRAAGSWSRMIMDDFARGIGASYRIEMESASNETIKQAVISGVGIACVSLHTLNVELRTRRLVLLDVAGFPVLKDWQIMHLRDRELSPVARAFREDLLRNGAHIIERAMGRFEPASLN